MANYKMRIEAEYEAIDKTLSCLPTQRFSPLISNITETFEEFKIEINRIII